MTTGTINMHLTSADLTVTGADAVPALLISRIHSGHAVCFETATTFPTAIRLFSGFSKGMK